MGGRQGPRPHARAALWDGRLRGHPLLYVLGVTYSVDGGISFQVGDSDNRLVIPSGITNVLARVTDSLGVTRIIGREIDCMGAGA